MKAMKRSVRQYLYVFFSIIGMFQITFGQQPELVVQAGHPTMIEKIAFSSDGKLLASASGNFGITNAANVIKLWDVSSGLEIRTFYETVQESDANIVVLYFDSNDKFITRISNHGVIKTWNLITGQEMEERQQTITSPQTSLGIKIVAVSPNGKIAVATAVGKKVLLLNTDNGKTIANLAIDTSGVRDVDFSPDGKKIAIGSYMTVKIWEVEGGRELKSLESPLANARQVEFSQDGKLLADVTGFAGNTIFIWNVESGQKTKILNYNAQWIRAIAFSSDGKQLASVSHNHIQLSKLAGGSEDKIFKSISDPILSAFLSPDGGTLVSRHLSSMKLWNLTGGQPIMNLQGKSDSVDKAIFSPDGKLLAALSGQLLTYSLKVWISASGKNVLDIPQAVDFPAAIAFSLDSKFIAISNGRDSLRLWEIETGRELPHPTELPEWGPKVAPARNNQFGVSSNGNSILIFNRKSGIKVTLFAVGETDWLVLTPEGLFDGSSGAFKKLIWRFNNNTFDYGAVELYFNDFFYPNLLQDVLAGKSPKPKAGQGLGKVDRRQPKVEIAAVNGLTQSQLEAHTVNQSSTDKRMATVTINVADNVSEKKQATHKATSGAQDLRLFRNGSLVKVWRGDVFKLGTPDGCAQIPPAKPSVPRRVRCQADVPIVAGENNFTAYAFNSSNIKSNDGELTITGADSLRRKGTAYIVAIGVNEYANKEYNLKYAVADAQDFAAELKRRQEGLKNYERVEVISLFDKDATKEKILQALAQLQGRTQPEDVVVVYFSGHGTAQEKQFFLLPHDLGYQGLRDKLDEAGLQTILARSISDRELEAAVEKIDAGQLVLVIDACNSGQALDAEEKRRGPMNSKGLAQLAYEKGMYILTAAKSYQKAWENSTLGHGYLTYALTEEGLRRGLADEGPKDGSVWLREWLNYATARVPRMQAEGLGKELRPKPQSATQRQATEAADAQTQTPRVFYRRELEAVPLIIAALGRL